MDTDFSGIVDQAVSLITAYGMNVIGAIVMLIVGWIAAGWASRATGKALARTDKVDETLGQFFTSSVRYLVLIITGLAVLSQFGVQTASLITVLGAAGLAVGLALQGTLSNVAAGVMLLLFRPFKIGDFVEVAGHAGTVGAITLFTTEMATPDNVHIVVPNASVWGAAVKNYSHHDTRRVDLTVGIAYEDDIDQAFAVISGIVENDERVLAEPAPMVAVTELADSSVNLVVRVWCQAGDYWPTKFDLTKTFKERLDKEGISIPYPQRTVHIVNTTAT
jgi:small conductance mechanosensitive channel